jgi:thiopeptide-type bacteriocin biosynthesis protein
MKDTKEKFNFAPSGFFALRTPLLPLTEWIAWGEGLEAASLFGDEARFVQAYKSDVARLRERLLKIVTQPEICDALFIASPNLNERFSSWADEPDSERGRKLEHVLVRYFARMCGRATPFGLFAGCSVGTIGDETNLQIEGREKYERHTRLDMDYLFALVNELKQDKEIWSDLSFRPNSSLYRAAGRVRYVESRVKDKKRSYHLVAVEDSDYLQATLKRAQNGAGINELAEQLTGAEISYEQARDYIHQLIENQILVPDLRLFVTGQEAIHPLIEQLKKNSATKEMSDVLAKTQDAIDAIDSEGLGVAPERYQSIATQLESLPTKVSLAKLFQVDMVKPAPESVLGEKVIREIKNVIENFHRMVSSPSQALVRFREEFTKRYESREVPLVEALDEEIGIGFGSGSENTPLLKDVAVFSPSKNLEEHSPRLNLLLQKLCHALQKGSNEIALTKEDIEKLSVKSPPPLPDGIETMFTLVASSTEALNKGNFRIIWHGAHGPCGARMLGRFCHADEKLRGHIENHLRAEEAHRPDAIFAEIVHQPEGRIGNVLARPVLREYEIAFLGDSGVADDKQILVTDLMVSVSEGRVRLRSKRLDKEIIPRMTNAHNYSWGSLGIYRFLCALQDQMVASGLGWSWDALNNAPYLPRVTFGKLILSLECWNITKDELKKLGDKKDAERFRAVQEWRREHRLPRYVLLKDADNTLPIDLDNPLCVDSFITLVRERGSITLTEQIPNADELCAYSPEGAFVHELIVPFIKSVTHKEHSNNNGQRTTDNGQAKRGFAPGSEWLYVKLYTGTATADQILRDTIVGVKEKVIKEKLADSWFFIRYSDPDWHLRLRFHGKPNDLQRKVLPEVQKAIAPLIDDGKIWRVQIDTYEREIERYGGSAGIELAERIFHADSEAALEIIEMLEPGDTGLDERWRLACAGMDLLLEDFGFNLQEKHSILQRARDGFFQEFGGEKYLAIQLGDKFRKERKDLSELLEYKDGHPLSLGIDVFRQRSLSSRPLFNELRELEQARRLTVSLHDLALSYLHLHANRLLRSAQRQQELVIYDLLLRHYDSLLARSSRSELRLQA